MPGMMPWKVSLLGISWAAGMPSFSNELRYRGFMLLPPSMSMPEKRQVGISECTMGSKTRAYSLRLGMSYG
jgi:hypothetical protein